MPITTPQQKIGQVRFFGGEFVDIKLGGDTFDASAKAALDYTKAENAPLSILLIMKMSKLVKEQGL